MGAPLEQVLECPESPDFIDATTSGFTYDSLAGLDYLQYPHTGPLGMPSVHTSPLLEFPSPNLKDPLAGYSDGSSYTTSSPGSSYTPPYSAYPVALMSLCRGEISSCSTSGRTSHGSGPHSPNLSSVPRSVRFNPIIVPSVAGLGRRRERRSNKHGCSSDDDDDFAPARASTTTINKVRLEEIRRQRIESEQRRCDELRNGYRRLKDTLPASNQKSSKVSLLDRATTHIKYLEMTQQQVQTRLQQAEDESARLRKTIEKLMQGGSGKRHATDTAGMPAMEQSNSSRLPDLLELSADDVPVVPSPLSIVVLPEVDGSSTIS